MFLLIFSRLLIKAGFSYIYNLKNKVKPIKVIIFGAGQSGLQTFASLKQNNSLGYKVVGFFDDNTNKVNKTLEGIMVYHSNELSPDLLQKLDAEVAIIAVQKISSSKKSALIDQFLSANLEVKVVPPADKWLDGNIDLKQIKNVRIEDLLERDPISLDSEHVKRELLGKTIFITGAAGSIGSEICRQVIQYHPRFIIAFDQAESALYDLEFELNRKGYQGKFKAIIGDVNKTSRIRFLFDKYRPEVVFHAAAYKHVPLMEGNPFEAIWVNVMGTKQIADFAVEFKCEKFVMVSTDKAVNPTNVMGAT
ncbi:MAG: polysaccharide biosynthesis protein, partial [Bacteroidia bacterium]